MSRRTRLLVVGASVAGIVLLVIVRAAWLCDDSYITIRTVDNFVHGYGLRWNIDERVQVYTHPLWLWCLVPIYLATASARITLLTTSVIAAAGALALLVREGVRRPVVTIAVLVALAASKSFVEYSTSGLEEPLLFCLLGGFAIVAGSARERSLTLGLLLAGLILLTRMDAILLVLPAMTVLLIQRRREAGLATLGAVAPVVAWLAFATFYYGVPFPNTAYAKLGHGVPRLALMAQGLRYLQDFTTMDPTGTLLVGLGGAFGLWRRRWEVPAGIGLWILYLVSVGGDFMSGRMLAPAVWSAGVLLVQLGPSLGLRSAVLIATTAAAALLGPSPAFWGRPVRAGDGRSAWRVTDERQFYYPTTGFLLHGFRETAWQHPWPRRVLAARDRGQLVQTFKWVGFAGYFAGPRVHLIDEYGLTDPLLARLPAEPDWAPGHFLRRVPAGYVASVADGTNHIQDDRIRRYYGRLLQATRAPLVAPGRMSTLLWLNFEEPRVSLMGDVYSARDGAIR
jgi:arabinofuranosyltransferase